MRLSVGIREPCRRARPRSSEKRLFPSALTSRHGIYPHVFATNPSAQLADSHTLIGMAPAQREPKVVVLGGGSWGTTVASICARRGPTLQWVRSEETANDINEKHRNTQVPRRRGRAVADAAGHHRLLRGRRLRRRHRDGCAVARLPRRARATGQGAAAVGAGGVAGEGPRAGHQLPDEPDRRRGAARPSGRHPGRAEHRPRGRRGLRRRRGARDARPASCGESRQTCSAPDDFGPTPPTTSSAWRWRAR